MITILAVAATGLLSTTGASPAVAHAAETAAPSTCGTSAIIASPAGEGVESDPVVVSNTEWRRNCAGGSFHVSVRNTGYGSRDIKVCLLRTNGQWDCGVQWGVESGATWSYWSCNATGRYWFASRDNNSSERFPNPPAN